jgi:putative hydrolase of the HAD superfamily
MAEASPERVRGVLFDLGGTLFSYPQRRGLGDAIGSVVETLAIEAEPRDIGDAWRRASSAAMKRYAPQPYFLHRDLFRDTLTIFAGFFDKVADPDLVQRFEDLQRQAVIDHLPIRRDCTTTLAALRARGLYLAIVSNIDDDYLHPLVQRHGLDSLLDDWTSSEEARSCKPHGGIYRHALAKGGLGTGETLFVGDSLHHDVAGASAIGLRAVHIVEAGIVTPLTDGLEALAEPDYEITNLSDLLTIVDELNAHADDPGNA